VIVGQRCVLLREWWMKRSRKTARALIVLLVGDGIQPVSCRNGRRMVDKLRSSTVHKGVDSNITVVSNVFIQAFHHYWVMVVITYRHHLS